MQSLKFWKEVAKLAALISPQPICSRQLILESSSNVKDAVGSFIKADQPPNNLTIRRESNPSTRFITRIARAGLKSIPLIGFKIFLNGVKIGVTILSNPIRSGRSAVKNMVNTT